LKRKEENEVIVNMFKKKRAQAAMEFLMTYGWAILVVLAAIGALAYFGVLSPDRFLPEKCTLPSGFACLDFKALGTAGFLLVVQNSAGIDMENISVNITDSTTAGTTGQTYIYNSTYKDVNSSVLANGQKSTYYVNVAGLSQGKFKGNININYVNKQTGISHPVSGELIVKV
jgi:hypothetical protein